MSEISVIFLFFLYAKISFDTAESILGMLSTDFQKNRRKILFLSGLGNEKQIHKVKYWRTRTPLDYRHSACWTLTYILE